MKNKVWSIVPWAVQFGPLKRKAYKDNESAQWRLYRVEDVACKLGVDEDKARRVLERTGFLKAVAMRNEVLLWKERLKKKEQMLHVQLKTANDREKIVIKKHIAAVQFCLANSRNLLRIPRRRNELDAT
jgi:hypothetical protein